MMSSTSVSLWISMLILAAFAKPQHRTRHRAVVSKGINHLPGGELQPQWRDP